MAFACLLAGTALISSIWDWRGETSMRADDSTNPPRLVQMTPPSALDSPPPAVDVQVGFGARSRQGPAQSVNDDHYLVVRMGRHLETLMTSLPDGDLSQPFDEYGYGMVIADGMGGAGEFASRLAIVALVQLAIDFGKWHVRVNEPIADEMMDRAERFYRSVDSVLRTSGDSCTPALQTTLTAVYTAGSELFFAHVGHSRAYLFRDDHLMQLTHDHTVDREGPGKATIANGSASAQDQHHVMTETLGVGGAGSLRIDVERCGLLDGDLVLLCTNGLTDVVDDAQIARSLRFNPTPDDKCRALLDLAANSGASDDVTALVAHYRIRTRTGDAEAGTNP
jgi:PPM family protein phosphatase